MLLRLMSRQHCPLCEEAEAVLTAVSSQLGLGWQRVDIDRDPELVARYGWDVPVLLRGQTMLMQHHFEAEKLRACLRQLAC
ncbi:MAG: glutaredoxin family protein [Mariprofundales bacterium]